MQALKKITICFWKSGHAFLCRFKNEDKGTLSALSPSPASEISSTLPLLLTFPYIIDP